MTILGMKLALSLIVIGLLFSAAGIYSFTLVSTNQKEISIEPLAGIFEKLDLNQGNRVQGTLRVLDGTAGIRVYVEDPSLEVIYNGGIVYSNLEFNINAQNSGIFRVNFENLNPQNKQTIEYSLTYPSNLGLTGYTAIVAGIILLGSGLATMLLSSRRHLNN